MAEPTEADRERAQKVVREAIAVRNFTSTVVGSLDRIVAQALADERERARAPFLAVLAEHQPTPAEDVGVGGAYPRDMCTCGESFHDDCEIRLAFRRAAEETGQ